MTRAFLVFGVVSAIYLTIADYRGMTVGQLFGKTLKETISGAPSRGFYHK